MRKHALGPSSCRQMQVGNVRICPPPPSLRPLDDDDDDDVAATARIITDTGCAEALARIFDRPDGKQFDYVFNCGGETRYSQDDEVYKLRSLALSLAVAREAAKRGVKAFVELSTGMVYKSDSAPSKEQDKLKPWNKIAVYKLQAEEELAKIEG